MADTGYLAPRQSIPKAAHPEMVEKDVATLRSMSNSVSGQLDDAIGKVQRMLGRVSGSGACNDEGSPGIPKEPCLIEVVQESTSKGMALLSLLDDLARTIG